MPERDRGFFRFLFQRRRAAPTETVGGPGTAIYAGYPEILELDRDLGSIEQRYKTYGNILANTSIVAAGVRYFLNLIGASAWAVVPSDADADGMYADRLTAMLMNDPLTPWHRIVRRAAMFRFY